MSIYLISCTVVPLTNIDFTQFEHKNEWDKTMKDKGIDNVAIISINNKSEKWGNDFLNYMKINLAEKKVKATTYLYDDEISGLESNLKERVKSNPSFKLYFTRTKKMFSTRSGIIDYFDIELRDPNNKPVWIAKAHIEAMDGTKQLAEKLVTSMVKDGVVK